METSFIDEWFEYANIDLSTAEFLLSMRPMPMEIICYHCQQSAEKFLKGYLISKDILEPPKTHNLILLHTMCIENDNRFNEISRACEALNRYGVQPRYPNEMEIIGADVQKAILYAQSIRNCEIFTELQHQLHPDSGEINKGK